MAHFNFIPCSAALCSALYLFPSELSAQDAMRPSLNQFGRVGLIDMPTAESLPDAELSFSAVHFAGSTRTTLNFQLTPRISGAFRYTGITNWTNGGSTFDRSFDINYRFMDEGRIRPALAIGLRDFMGTGLYSSQYFVATKNIGSTVKISAGLGWGRISGIKTPQKIAFGLGGKPNIKAWFRGTPAFFGGLEWQTPIKGLRLKAEYSPDQYVLENQISGSKTSPSFKLKSPLNFGFSYMTPRHMQISGYYMYGSTVGMSLSFAINPKRPRQFLKPRAQPPVIPILARTNRSNSAPTLFAASTSTDANSHYINKLQALVVKEAISIVRSNLSGRNAEIQILNIVFPRPGAAIERTMRAMSQVLPSQFNSFSVVLLEDGLPVSKTTIDRSHLEQIGADTTGRIKIPDLLSVKHTPAHAVSSDVTVGGYFPKFSSSLAAAVVPHLFDPDGPVRADLRIKWNARFDISPGLSLSSEVSARLVGNIADNKRGANSVLPHVRTDVVHYQQNSDITIDRLTVDYMTKLSPDLYGRINAGIFEQMYGGVSAELLWAPVNSRLALGAEISWAKKRDYDQLLSFRNYSVVTGHVSAYWDIGNSYYGQVDVGRYLAGDIGATLSLERRFENGWRIGAFATLTDVSFADFGEGSFDKGITITVPYEWLLGKKTRQSRGTTIRSISRDGGARLSVPNRLYDIVSAGTKSRILNSW